MEAAPKTRAEVEVLDELARAIVQALGFEFLDCNASLGNFGVGAPAIAIRTTPGVRTGRREHDRPAYVSREQFDRVTGLLALHALREWR